MKKIIKSFLALVVLTLVTNFVFAQYKMDSDGKTLRNSSNAAIGRIDSDGKTIRNANNSSVGVVDSDGKTIRNGNNSSVLKLDGTDIRNSGNSTIANIKEVMSTIQGAKPTAVYVALWWFLVKGNK